MEMESGELQVEFGQEQIIWAKITGYPWWPALITALPCKRNSCFRVDFFADNTHAFVSPSKIAKYSLLRSDIDLHRHMKKGLRKAILSADHALAQRLSALPARTKEPLPHEPQLPPQKQLSETPFIKSTRLQEPQQEHNHSQQHPQQPQDLQLPQEQQEDESQEEEEPAPQYSLEQRERYVNNLLKKYQLLHIGVREVERTKRTARGKEAPRRREVQPLKKIPQKTKRIIKVSQLSPSLVFLLSRRLDKFLKDKEGLPLIQRRTITLNLCKQIESRNQQKFQGAIEEIHRLFKWLQISSAATIAAYYQSWSSFQSQKEKPSNTTIDE